MSQPLFYTVFHLNLAFSSIEEEDRPLVIERCYWPILKLAETFPIGIEATGYTLAAIAEYAPDWIEKFRELISKGDVELVGSGAVQLISPLVPPEVTRKNLALGIDDYNKILGVRPKIALINEQAFAPGILPLYEEVGFKAVMMDWSEAASHNPEWPRNLASQPQVVSGAGVEMPVLWSDAISFQKFQRYAHGELGADEYFEFLALQCEKNIQALPLYTSDGEVFDYRPGRFDTEANLESSIEFERINALFAAIAKSGMAELSLPSDVLSRISVLEKPIQITTPAAPVTVKKQRKYNILRWAVTGQNDLKLNTHCWRMLDEMDRNSNPSEADWRLLLHVWASDFRTHITPKRWQKLQDSLKPVDKTTQGVPAFAENERPCSSQFQIETRGHYLVVQTERGHLVLNSYRGMAIQAFGFGPYEGAVAGAPGANSLIGTLAHGFFDDIQYGADFYSAHMVYEPSDAGKVSDLARCDIGHSFDSKTGQLIFLADIPSGIGNLKKTLRLSVDSHELTVEYDLPDDLVLWGSLRLAHITLNPRAFDPKTLYFESFNGGENAERHALQSSDGLLSVEHGRPVNKLVSASTGLGMTSGTLVLGDASRSVTLSMKRTDAAGIGMVSSQQIKDSFFVRALISLKETDETARKVPEAMSKNIEPIKVRYKITLQE